jgi:hypothetical protein
VDVGLKKMQALGNDTFNEILQLPAEVQHPEDQVVVDEQLPPAEKLVAQQPLLVQQPPEVSSQSRTRSQFQSIICAEDLEHIAEVMNVDIDAMSVVEANDLMYKAVTRPVQMACINMVRLGTSFEGQLLTKATSM